MNPTRLVLVLMLVALLVVPVTGTHAPPGHTEPPGRSADNDDTSHPADACSSDFHVQGAGWDFCWQQDDLRVQGLELNRVFFHNESVIWRIGVPFSLTKYESASPGPFKDVLGRPDDANLPGFGQGSMAIDPDSCPRFLPHGDLRNDDRLCVEHRGGVEPAVSVWARYDLINYKFLQGYHLDARGYMEPFVSLGGHLIDGPTVGAAGQNHYHHMYSRVDFDIASPGGDNFQVFKRSEGITPSGQALAVNAPVGCEPRGAGTAATWCDVPAEAQLVRQHETYDKWRVQDRQAQNAQERPRSYEFVVHSDGPANEFSTFDTMVLQHQGDSQQIGYEVPSLPRFGDVDLKNYMIPPDAVTDPVAWVVQHTYHDTRDEDSPAMHYHHAGFVLRPNNFMDENPAEHTFP